MAGADIAGMEDVGAYRLENRLHLGEQVSRRSDHDRDRAGIRAVRAAAYRRVDHMHAFFGEPSRHLPGLAGIAGRHVSDDLPRSQHLGDSTFTEEHIAHLGGSRQAGHHHLALAGERLRTLRRHCAELGKAAQHLGPQVEGAQLMLAHQSARERPTHIPQSDIAELHHHSPVIALADRFTELRIIGGGKERSGPSRQA